MKSIVPAILFANVILAHHHCPPQIFERVLSGCKNFEEPELTKVRYDQTKREFSYTLNYRESALIERDTYDCKGHFQFRESLNVNRPGSVFFRQPEEGNADFTLLREVRAYIRDHSG